MLETIGSFFNLYECEAQHYLFTGPWAQHTSQSDDISNQTKTYMLLKHCSNSLENYRLVY